MSYSYFINLQFAVIDKKCIILVSMLGRLDVRWGQTVGNSTELNMVRNWTLATKFDFQIPKSMQPDDIVHLWYFKLILSIYKFGLSVWVSVCLFVSNKRQNGWTDRAQIFCWTSRDHREGLWMIKNLKKCVLKVFNFVKNLNSWKSAIFFCKSAKFSSSLF